MVMPGTMGGIVQNVPVAERLQRVQPVLQTVIFRLVPPAVMPPARLYIRQIVIILIKYTARLGVDFYRCFWVMFSIGITAAGVGPICPL